MSLTQYLKTIEQALIVGNATEHTHRSALALGSDTDSEVLG